MNPVTENSRKTVDRSQSLWGRFSGKIASLFKKHKKKKLAAIGLLGVALIMILVGNNQARGIPVSTGEVVKNSFEKAIFATGKLEVKGKQEFYAESTTNINEILVNAGEKVVKGQLILRTDDSDLTIEASKNRLSYDDIQTKLVSSESNIRVFQQDYNLAQKKYDVTKALLDAGAASQQELDNAEKEQIQANEKLLVERDANLPLLKSQLVQARLIWEKSEEKLQKTKVLSPMDGVLLNLPVKKGQRVEQGTLLAEIGDPGKLQIETGINEIDAAQLKAGDKVEISNNALLEEPFGGHIEYISSVAEVIKTSQGEQTQVKIRIAVNQTEKINVLKPGYNVNLKIILDNKKEAL